jgi:hypothetical protein
MDALKIKEKTAKALKAAGSAFLFGIKAVGKALALYLDDLFYMAGLGCFAACGFILHTAAGLGVLGAGLITYGVLIAKGGIAYGPKKRAKAKDKG